MSFHVWECQDVVLLSITCSFPAYLWMSGGCKVFASKKPPVKSILIQQRTRSTPCPKNRRMDFMLCDGTATTWQPQQHQILYITPAVSTSCYYPAKQAFLYPYSLPIMQDVHRSPNKLHFLLTITTTGRLSLFFDSSAFMNWCRIKTAIAIIILPRRRSKEQKVPRITGTNDK